MHQILVWVGLVGSMTTDAQEQVYLHQIASADVPDVTDTSYQAQFAALGDYAQTASNEVLAQYRFMGLLAGIKGPNDTDEDVTNARNAIMEALGDFLQAGPLAEQVSAKTAEIQTQHADLNERVVDMLRSGEYDNTGYLAAQNLLDTVGREHPHDILEGTLEGIARGDMAEHWTSSISQVPVDMQADFTNLVELQTQVAGLEDARRGARRQAIIDWFKGLWVKIKAYYDENMELIRNGQWLLATGRIAIDVAIFAAEEIIVAGIVIAIIGLTGGLAVGMALALRGAVRMALSVVRQGTRTVRRINATWDFKIELRRVEPGVLYSNPIPINVTATRKLDYEYDVNVQTDLTPDERLALGEGGQGSTRPDADAPEQGNGAHSEDDDIPEGNNNPPRGPQRDVECFPPPPNGTPDELAEFDRQLKEQQDTINNMTADDMAYAQTVLDHARQRWRDMGNTGSGTHLLRDSASQRAARQEYRENLDLAGFDEEQIIAQMSKLDATHFLDIIAGGDPRSVGMGGSAANQRIGPTWARTNTPTGVSRSGQLGQAANELRMDGRSDHKMNVRLTSC